MVGDHVRIPRAVRFAFCASANSVVHDDVLLPSRGGLNNHDRPLMDSMLLRLLEPFSATSRPRDGSEIMVATLARHDSEGLVNSEHSSSRISCILERSTCSGFRQQPLPELAPLDSDSCVIDVHSSAGTS